MFPSNPSMMPMGPSGGSPMGPPVAGSSPQSKGLGGMFGGDAMGRRGFRDFMSSTSSGAAARGGMMPGGAPSMMPSAPPGGMPMPVSPPMGGSPMMAPPIGGMGGMGPQPMGMGPMGQPPMGQRPMGPMQPRPMQRPMGFAAGGAVPMRTEIRGMPHDLSYITADEAEILELLGGTGERGPGGVRAYPPVNEGGSTGTSDRGSFNDEPSRGSSSSSRDYGGYDPVGSIDGGQFDSGEIDTSPSYDRGGDDWGARDDNDRDRGRDYGGISTYDPVGSTVGGQFDSGDDYDFGPVYGGGDGDGGVFSQPSVSAAISADRDDRADIYDFGGDIYRDTDVGVSAPKAPSSGFAPESGVGLGPSSRALEVTRGVSPAADVDLGVGSSVTGSLGPLAGDDLLDLLADVDVGRVFAPGTQVAQMTGAPSATQFTKQDLIDRGIISADPSVPSAPNVQSLGGFDLDEPAPAAAPARVPDSTMISVAPTYSGYGSEYPFSFSEFKGRYRDMDRSADMDPYGMEDILPTPEMRAFMNGELERFNYINDYMMPPAPFLGLYDSAPGPAEVPSAPTSTSPSGSAQNTLTQSDMDYLSTVTGRPYPSSALGTPISDEEQKYLDQRADDLAKAAQARAAADPNWGKGLGVPDVDSLAPSLTNMPDEAMLPSGRMPSSLPEIFIPGVSGSTAAPSSVPRTDIAAVESLYSRPEDTGVFVARPNVDVTDDYRADRREIYSEPGLGDVEYMLSIAGNLPGYQTGPLEDYVTDVEDRFLETRSDRRDFEAIPPSPSVVTAPEASAPYEIPREVIARGYGYPSVTRLRGFDAPELPAAEVVRGGLVPGRTSTMSLGEFAGVTDRSPENTIGYGALPADAEFLGLPSGPVPSADLSGTDARLDREMDPTTTITSSDAERLASFGRDSGEHRYTPAAETTEPVTPAPVVDTPIDVPEDVTPPTDAEVVAEMERSGLSYEDAYKQLMAERSGLSQFGTGVLELLGNAFIPGAGTAGVAALEKQREKRAEEIAYDISIGGEPVYNKNGDLIGVVDLAGVYNGFSYGTGFDADGNRLGDDYQESIRDAIPSTEDNLFGDGADERDCPEGYTFDIFRRQCVPVEEAGDTGDTGDTGEGDGDDTDGRGYSLTPIQQPDFYTSLYDDVEMLRSGGPVMSSVDRFMASFG